MSTALYVPDEFCKMPAAYGSAFDDMMKIAREEYNRQLREMLSTPTTPRNFATNCTTCGTHNGCVCAKSMSVPPTCYVCGVKHPYGIAPRVCDQCRGRYL